MSVFEDYLTYGRYISQAEKYSLYKYLLLVKLDSYSKDAAQLLKDKTLIRSIAGGLICYQLVGDYVSYSCKRVSEENFSAPIRTIKLSFINSISISKLTKYFAQVEVDVLSNYPLQGKGDDPNLGFGFIVYPYYDLNYYSNGKGKLRGLIKKLQLKDDPLLKKLLAS
jgi:hypothetical protein